VTNPPPFRLDGRGGLSGLAVNLPYVFLDPFVSPSFYPSPFTVLYPPLIPSLNLSHLYNSLFLLYLPLSILLYLPLSLLLYLPLPLFQFLPLSLCLPFCVSRRLSHFLRLSIPYSIPHSILHSIPHSIPPFIPVSIPVSIPPGIPPPLPESFSPSLPQFLPLSLPSYLPPSLPLYLRPIIRQCFEDGTMIGRNLNLDFVHLVLKHKGQYITTDMIENSGIFCYSASLKNKRKVPKGV
jgi:hypothetical protein